MKYIKYIQCAFMILLLFSIDKTSYARGNIVAYFLNNPNAWIETKNIIQVTPVKVVVTGGLKGVGFNLVELTGGDEVTLIFLETKKVEKLKRKGFYRVGDKLLPGNNRVVSVITRNYGKRTQFHYKFMLQRNINNVPVTIYNNDNSILESKYDGSTSIKDVSNLSGIKLCEIEVH